MHAQLRDRGHRQIRLPHLDGNGLWHELLCEQAHVVRIGRAEEQHLQILVHKLANLSDLGSHLLVLVEHHIGLVQDEHLDRRGVDDALLHQVSDLAGGANQHMLRHLAPAWEPLHGGHHEQRLHLQELPELSDHRLVLSRQLPGGANHHRLRQPHIDIDHAQQGQRESRGLARSVLRLADHVLGPAAADQGQGGCLDLGGPHEAHLEDAVQDFLGQVHLLPRLGCQVVRGQVLVGVLDDDLARSLAHKSVAAAAISRSPPVVPVRPLGVRALLEARWPGQVCILDLRHRSHAGSNKKRLQFL
mmetsp:Transcript_24056/g.68128  ORF Transcript_24056/g.68128 Transcript_24056/m.68128 type:complete len:302 (-) Transcript_24056:66-971(-)